MTVSTAVSHNARPYLHGPEFEAAAQALRDGQYGHAGLTEQFEAETARYLGVPDVVAVASGTAALQLSLLAAGVGPDDEVIVPSETFCATIQAIVAVGAVPRFIDVSPRTLCVDSNGVRDALTPATRAVMPVLYGGRAVDLADVRHVLSERGISVIEDAAHAFGSYAGTVRVGATGDLTCFSFGPIKNLTCIEGGAIVPRTPEEGEALGRVAKVAPSARRAGPTASGACDRKAEDRSRTGRTWMIPTTRRVRVPGVVGQAGLSKHALRELRVLGITQPQARRVRATTYDVARFGLRATMSAVHASVGIVQLRQFPDTARRRQELWRTYAAGLRDLGVGLVDVDIDRTVPFNCVVRVRRRDQAHAVLTGLGIGVGVHYPPNHLQPAFARWRRELPVTEQLGAEIMSLPFHPAMTASDASDVVAMLSRTLEGLR
ncbi:aminotransferase class I/II-fold pyridoxal phosphate-dependent enzyme [Streptomyces sp. NBC_01511]|uniref:DegT/DnrJ/EryC1/StrS family aminotransferase n=1 Tax=Streptomyces sp. NBC_01511 TaxID=2903889 RepID=UPI0038630210